VDAKFENEGLEYPWSDEPESVLRDLLDSSLLGVTYISDGAIRYLNSTAERMLGMTASQALGMTIEDAIRWIHVEDREQISTRYREAGPDVLSQDAHVVFRWSRPDGVVRWFKVQTIGASFLGRPAIRAVMVDVTEQYETLEKLRRSEERYRQMVEASPSGILVHVDERVVLANRAAVRLFRGRTEADVVGKRILDYIAPCYHALVRQRVERIYGGEDCVPVVELVFRTLAGESFWVEASASSVEHEGRPASMVVFRDITQRKKALSEKEHLEAQLLQSQKLEAVGRLAGGVAHDFNNLLTEICGQSELVLMDLPPEDPHFSMMQAVGEAAQRASALTRQLLAFSRKQVMLPRLMQLNEVVSGLERMLSRLIGEDIEFQVALSPAAGQVMVDPGQLEQVILNLCVNARDAMPGGGKLLVTTGVEVPDERAASRLSLENGGRYAVLSVVDTGCGMTPEVQARLFEPFFTTKPQEQGTGLGLSTSYGIVRQHLGAIDVRSLPGRGSVFRVFLPQADGPAQESMMRGDEVDANGGGETILCVEDEPLVREVTVTMLRRLGYRVLEAEHPNRAIDLVRAHSGRIDLLVTDVIMPQMNGRELAECLRRDRPELAVLYTSGYTEDVIANQGLLASDVRFLGKPFTLKSLSAAVKGALKLAPEASSMPPCNGRQDGT